MRSSPDRWPRWRVIAAGQCAIIALRLTQASEFMSDLGRAILTRERFSDVRSRRKYRV